MLSFFATNVDGAKVLDDFQYFNLVITDDNHGVLLRFADTRVLPNLPSVLTADQWGQSAAIWCIGIILDELKRFPSARFQICRQALAVS